METARTTGCILLSLLASLLLALSFSAQASNTISIGVVADNEPYSSMGPLGPRGFSIDVLNELSQQTQIDFRYRMGSWPEIYSAFLRGDLDAIDEVSWRPERVGKMLFTEPYHLRQTVIVHNPANPLPPVKTVEDLQPFRLGVMRDIYYADAFQDAGIEVRHYDLLPDYLLLVRITAKAKDADSLAYFGRPNPHRLRLRAWRVVQRRTQRVARVHESHDSGDW